MEENFYEMLSDLFQKYDPQKDNLQYAQKINEYYGGNYKAALNDLIGQYDPDRAKKEGEIDMLYNNYFIDPFKAPEGSKKEPEVVDYEPIPSPAEYGGRLDPETREWTNLTPWYNEVKAHLENRKTPLQDSQIQEILKFEEIANKEMEQAKAIDAVREGKNYEPGFSLDLSPPPMVEA